MIDSYISDELLVETNHEVLHHLENCPACREMLAAHRDLRVRLRSAVKKSSEMQIDPAFAANLRAKLRETARSPNWWETFRGNKSVFEIRMLSAALLCLLVIAGSAAIWIKYQKSSPDIASVGKNQSNRPIDSNGSNGNSSPSQSPIMQAVEVTWREIANLAAGDHQNCALKFRLEEKPISLEDASVKYGKFNKDLDKAVIKPLREIFPANTSGEIKLLEAHSCVFEGRRFAHIILRRAGHLISVLVTETDFNREIDEEMFNQQSDNLQVAGFRTKHYAVFVISDLTDTENLGIAQTITASVRQHIKKFEV